LSNGLPYQKAIELIDKYNHFRISNLHASKDTKSFTHYLQSYLVDIENTEEDLGRFLDENQDKLGAFNNTAYNNFKIFFDKVQSELARERKYVAMGFDGEDKYTRVEVSFEEVCKTMRMKIPQGLSKSQLSILERAIYDDAPSRQNLVHVYNRTPEKNGAIPQVKRKSLMMIWLLANEYKSTAKGKVDIINRILEDSGMPKLDTKNPFDWLFTYVLLSAEKEGEQDSVMFEEFIQKIYGIED